MIAHYDELIKDVVCTFSSDETKSIRSMLNMLKSGSNRLTDDLNRYSLDFKRFTIKDLATYTTMINTILTASIRIAELLSEAEYLTAYELNRKEESCHSQH